MASAGRKASTLTRLNRIALDIAQPRSGPIRKAMNTRARNPVTVVSPLESTLPADCFTAAHMAASAFIP